MSRDRTIATQPMRVIGGLGRTMAIVLVSGLVLAWSGTSALAAEMNQAATQTFGPEDFLPLDPGSDQADVPTETYGPEDFQPLGEEPEMADVPTEMGEVIPRDATPPARSAPGRTGGADSGGTESDAAGPVAPSATGETGATSGTETSDESAADAVPTSADRASDAASGWGSLELVAIAVASVLFLGALALVHRSRRTRTDEGAPEAMAGGLR